MQAETPLSEGRQILVNFGNRYVVFGSPAAMPSKLAFEPGRDAEVLPRVPAEHEFAEERAVRTLLVDGLERTDLTSEQADLALTDGSGRTLLVDVKVRDRPPRGSDFEQAFKLAARADAEGQEFETWFFNLERLTLTLIGSPDVRREQRLVALDVWEKTDTSLFTRADVLKSVADWEASLRRLYDQVASVLSEAQHLRIDTSRTVTMSEELMQRFAVADRELPILDVVRNDSVAASLVPRALWVVGSFGRIDLITLSGTKYLVRREKAPESPWDWVDPANRRQRNALDANAIRSLVNS